MDVLWSSKRVWRCRRRRSYSQRRAFVCCAFPSLLNIFILPPHASASSCFGVSMAAAPSGSAASLLALPQLLLTFCHSLISMMCVCVRLMKRFWT